MAEPDPSAEWWTIDDVARYLGVARDTVHSYRSRRQMPAHEQQYGRTALWRPATITSWAAERRTDSKRHAAGQANST